MWYPDRGRPRSAQVLLVSVEEGVKKKRSGVWNTSDRKSTSKIGDETVLSQNLRAAWARQNKLKETVNCQEENESYFDMRRLHKTLTASSAGVAKK